MEAVATKPYRQYSMNIVGRSGRTTTIAIPPEVIEAKAKEANLTPEEFIRCFRVVARFDKFPLSYTFEESL